MADLGKVFEFGPFRLNVDERLLTRDGNPLPLRGKVFDTLRVLIENRGHLLGKGELLQAVWPDRFVEENNLAHNITTLRKALGERNGGSKYVETVPRLGYRFVADVREVSTPDSAAHPAPPAVDNPAGRIVQRESDLMFLDGCLEKALGGTRQVVFVTGETGLGKTTLVNGFLERVRGTARLWVGHGQCLEYRGPGEPYMPLLEIFGRMCREQHGPEVVTILKQRAPAWVVHMPWLVSEPEFEILQKKVIASTHLRMLREAVEAIEALAVRKPVILVLEDLHWSDHSTVDLLSGLARRRDPAALLLIGTYRPAEARKNGHPIDALASELKLRCQCHELPMTFLTGMSVADCIASRFPDSKFPAGLVDLLHSRTEGNPLFLVTLLDHWIAEGAISEDAGCWTLRRSGEELARSVPDSLRELIQHQLEHLAGVDQQILEASSVVEGEFSAALASAVIGRPAEEVEERLAALVRQDQFLRPRGAAEWDDGTIASCYEFIHGFYREVLYDRIPAGRRSVLHQRAGERLEAAWSRDRTPVAAALAKHFTAGRDVHRAARYLRMSADQALRRNAHREAIGLLERALETLSGLPQSRERAQSELPVLMTLGPALIATKGWAAPEVEAAMLRARQLSLLLEEPSGTHAVLFGLAALHEFRGQYRRAEELLKESAALERRSGGDFPRVESRALLACSLFHQGASRRAIASAEEGSSLYDPDNQVVFLASFGENPGVACHDWAALSLWFLGYPDQALDRVNRALAMALEPAHLYSMASAQTKAAFLHQFRREYKLAEKWAGAAIALAAERGFPYRIATGSILKGWALAVQGRHEEGIALLQQGLAGCRAVGAEMDRPYYLALLAEAYESVGRRQEALSALSEAFEMVRASRSFFYEAELHRLRGALLESTGASSTEAEDCYRQALDTARTQEARSLELRAATSLASYWRSQRRLREARDLLLEIHGWFSEGFETPDLQNAQSLIKSLTTELPARTTSAAAR